MFKPPATLSRNTVAAIASAVALISLTACGGGGGGGSSTPTPSVPTPTVSVTASAPSVALGQPVTVTWTSTDATTCTGGFGTAASIPLNAAEVVTMNTAGKLTYNVSCTGAGGTKTASVDVTVNSPVKVLAGNPTGFGWVDGSSSEAQFGFVNAIARGADGALYVTDSGNLIRKIDSQGKVTTLAGSLFATNAGDEIDGQGKDARFAKISSVAVDGTGTIYAAEYDSGSLRKITADGLVSTIIRFPTPSTEKIVAVCVSNSDHLYVLRNSMSIDEIDANTGAKLKTIVSGNVINAVAYTGSIVAASFTYNAKTNEFMFGAIDSVSHKPAIQFVSVAGSHRSVADLTLPDRTLIRGLAADGDNIYVSITSVDWWNDANAVWPPKNHQILKYNTTTGNKMILAGGSGYDIGSADGVGSAAKFNLPTGLVSDGAGTLFLADGGNRAIRKIKSDGTVSLFAGKPVDSGYKDGTLGTAKFNDTEGVTTNGAGDIFVSDYFNGTIRKITADGSVTTLTGNQQNRGHVDGDTATARLGGVWGGIVSDLAGNVYFTDVLDGSNGYTIRKITPSGTVTTIAGRLSPGTYPPEQDGIGAAAIFNWGVYCGLAIDTDHDYLYTCGFDNSGRPVIRGIGIANGGTDTPSYHTLQVIESTKTYRYPFGIVFSKGFIYATFENSVYKVNPATGKGEIFAGNLNNKGSKDGQGTDALFSAPRGIAADADGNLYVADFGNGLIRKITSTGMVSTVLGTPGKLGNDTNHAPISLSSPSGISIRGKVLTFTTGNGVLQYTLP